MYSKYVFTLRELFVIYQEALLILAHGPTGWFTVSAGLPNDHWSKEYKHTHRFLTSVI